MKTKGNILTKEERDVVALAAFHPWGQYLSLSYAEIGQRLGMSAARAKWVMHRACVKLKAHNRIEAVLFAHQRGEIGLNEMYSLDELAKIFGTIDPHMCNMILNVVRYEIEYGNLPGEDEQIINIDTEDRRQDLILTDTERDIIALTARGLTNQEIADRLYLSVSSVKTLLYRAYTKLGARNRVEAVILALKRGEASLDEMFSLNELLQSFAPLGAEILEELVQLQNQNQDQEPVPTAR